MEKEETKRSPKSDVEYLLKTKLGTSPTGDYLVLSLYSGPGDERGGESLCPHLSREGGEKEAFEGKCITERPMIVRVKGKKAEHTGCVSGNGP